jgi:hypothetical protein
MGPTVPVAYIKAEKENLEHIGHMFFISWFMGPPTLILGEMEKEKKFQTKLFFFFSK